SFGLPAGGDRYLAAAYPGCGYAAFHVSAASACLESGGTATRSQSAPVSPPVRPERQQAEPAVVGVRQILALRSQHTRNAGLVVRGVFAVFADARVEPQARPHGGPLQEPIGNRRLDGEGRTSEVDCVVRSSRQRSDADEVGS